MHKRVASALRRVLATLSIQQAEQVPTLAQGTSRRGKVTRKKGNAAALKRASKKASNIRKFN